MKRDNDALVKWIDANGGTLAVAKKLKLPLGTVRHWHYLLGRPNYHTAIKLKKLSGGVLTLEKTLKPVGRKRVQ